MTTHYSISKTTKAEIERLLKALTARKTITLREVNDNRRAKLMLNKLARLNHNGQS